MTPSNLELFQLCDDILKYCDTTPIKIVRSDEFELGEKHRIYLDICLTQLENDKYLNTYGFPNICITPLGQSFIRTQGYINKFIKESNYEIYIEQLRLSTLDTNKSVQKTNLDTQSNFVIQKRLTIISVLVSLLALIIAGLTYFKDDDKQNQLLQQSIKDTQKELQRLNKTLENYLVVSDSNLTHQKKK